MHDTASDLYFIPLAYGHPAQNLAQHIPAYKWAHKAHATLFSIRLSTGIHSRGTTTSLLLELLSPGESPCFLEHSVQRAHERFKHYIAQLLSMNDPLIQQADLPPPQIATILFKQWLGILSQEQRLDHLMLRVNSTFGLYFNSGSTFRVLENVDAGDYHPDWAAHFFSKSSMYRETDRLCYNVSRYSARRYSPRKRSWRHIVYGSYDLEAACKDLADPARVYC